MKEMESNYVQTLVLGTFCHPIAICTKKMGLMYKNTSFLHVNKIYSDEIGLGR